MTSDLHNREMQPVEVVLVRNTIKRGILYPLLLVPVFWLTRGFDGGWSSALGIVVVVGNLWLTGVMLSFGFRVSLAMYHAAAVLGFFLRLGLIMGSMLVIARVVEVDRVAFGVSVVLSFVVLLGIEMMAMVKGKERELEWSN